MIDEQYDLFITTDKTESRTLIRLYELRYLLLELERQMEKGKEDIISLRLEKR